MTGKKSRNRQSSRTDPKEELEIDMTIEVGVGLSQEDSPLILGDSGTTDLKIGHRRREIAKSEGPSAAYASTIVPHGKELIFEVKTKSFVNKIKCLETE